MVRRRTVGIGTLLLGVAACIRPGGESPATMPAVASGAAPVGPVDGASSEGLAPPPAVPAPEGPAAEPEMVGVPQLRAFWVDAFHDGIKTPAQVDVLVRTAQAASANTLIVQVRRRGDAYYRRTTEPRTEDSALAPEFDALQAVIDRAHAAQPPLEVHAWIATVALWNNQYRAPTDPAHAFNRHGPTAPDADHWISLSNAGQAWDGDNYMLDPGHPDAARYMAAVAVELAREYGVDGIHLDLVRYAGVQWGYNPASVARYNRRYGASAQPAPGDLRWQQWRRDQVTALVRRIYLDCLVVQPSLKISAAVIGWGSGPVDERTWRTTSAYRNVFQDWLGWVEEGVVDVAMPMNYDDEANAEQRAWFDQWLEWEKTHQGKRQIAAGMGLFLNAPASGLAQIRRALAPSADGTRLAGVALYSYAVTNAPARGNDLPSTPNSRLYAVLSGAGDRSALGGEDPPFAGPAVPPSMPWKENPGAHVRGTVTSRGQPLDGVAVRLEGPSDVTLQTDGNGYFGAPDLIPGVYAVTFVYEGLVRTRADTLLPAGRVTTVDLAD